MSEFYIYVYLREDGSPYYVGKGKGNRAWSKNRRIPRPTDSSRIVIVKETLTETEAFSEEMRLITFYGRKDNGTGILRNLTDGGEGTSGYIPSTEHRAKQSAAVKKYFEDPEARARHSAAQKKAQSTPEARARNSAAQKLAWIKRKEKALNESQEKRSRIIF
jgi:hypothetical protein